MTATVETVMAETVMAERGPGVVPAGPMFDPGGWLVEQRRALDRAEAEWLAVLADFDLSGAWQADGQLSCADWLIWRAGMARATAYEKLRVAHELRRRPAVREALAAGRISYSATRAIVRADRPDANVDEAFIEVAASGTVADVERVVHLHQLHVEQERPPPDPATRRGLHIRRGIDGTSTLQVTLSDVEVEEVGAVLQAFMDLSSSASPVDQSARADTAAGAVEESARADTASWPNRRADALLDALRCGLAHAGDGHAMGADRYLIHLISRVDGLSLLDGTPLDGPTAGRVSCDASTVTHLLRHGEPLTLGRRQRQWSSAQRRAILVRDRGHCRFPGCQRRYTDIHHLTHWADGGTTDITNGLLLCPRHHSLLHHGYHATGNANHHVNFHRPDDTLISPG